MTTQTALGKGTSYMSNRASEITNGVEDVVGVLCLGADEKGEKAVNNLIVFASVRVMLMS